MKKRLSKRKQQRIKPCPSDDVVFKPGMFKQLALESLKDSRTLEQPKKNRRCENRSACTKSSDVDLEKPSDAQLGKVKKRRRKRKHCEVPKAREVSELQDLSSFSDGCRDKFRTKLECVLREGCILPFAGFQQAAETLIKQVYHIAARCFYPRLVSVRPFGSLAQDTCISGSDVDMCVFFVDGPEPSGRGKSGKLLRSLCREMRRPPATKSLQVIEEILEATVPILKVRSLGSQCLDADISLGSRQQTSCDEAVRSLLEKEVVAQQCVRLIKYWAQREAVNKAYHGFPSSFSWVLLTIFYLQQEGVLPCRQESAKERSAKSLKDLLAGFFVFCMSSQLNDRWNGISVARGRFRKLSEPAQVLFIEVPGEPSHNAARCLRPEKWKLVLQKAKRALSSLAPDAADSFLCRLMEGGVEKGHERLAPPWSDSEDSTLGHFHALDDIEDF